MMSALEGGRVVPQKQTTVLISCASWQWWGEGVQQEGNGPLDQRAEGQWLVIILYIKFPCFSGFKMPLVAQFYKISGQGNLLHRIHQIWTLSHWPAVAAPAGENWKFCRRHMYMPPYEFFGPSSVGWDESCWAGLINTDGGWREGNGKRERATTVEKVASN